MLKTIRYLILIVIAVLSFVVLRKKTSKLRILKAVAGFTIAVTLFMPFENLILTFSSPQNAFSYTFDFGNIIEVIENKNSALVIYDDKGSTTSTLIIRSDDRWKAPFLPNDSTLGSLAYNSGIFMLTKERNDNNFYLMLTVNNGTKSISDNQNSIFKKYFEDGYYTKYVAYIENCDNNYVVDIDGKKTKLL